MNKGKLIVVEGACDGIGKSTQYELLYNSLIKDNFKVTKHHFPSYGTEEGAPVEKFLKGELGSPKDLSPYLVNSLYAVDRAITWQTILKPDYEQGNIILLDRYTTSSLIYQSATIEDIEEKKKFLDYVTDYEYNKLGIQKPDMVIFLFAPFEIVTKMRNLRKQNDGIENDVFEKDIELMKKIYENAVFVANYLSWNIINCANSNEVKSIDDIHQDIKKLVKTLNK